MYVLWKVNKAKTLFADQQQEINLISELLSEFLIKYLRQLHLRYILTFTLHSQLSLIRNT